MIEYTPPRGVDHTAPFFQDLEKDWNERRLTNVAYLGNDGGASMNQYRSVVQLMFQKRYTRTYAEIGMRPTRSWKITDIKKYYGVKGNANKVADQLDAIHASILDLIKQANEALSDED
jgi:hypothetical protein